MIRQITRKAAAVLVAAATLMSMTVFSVSVSAAETDETGATGVYYETYGSQTLLESAGITYAAYMKWLEDHDDRSALSGYYLGTPYAGYFPGTPFDTDDYRTPNGEPYTSGDVPPSYAPYNGHAMNCTGFVWNVLMHAGKNCGAPQSKLDALPVVSGHVNYWSSHDIFRYYFSGEDCIQDALDSGLLEKGDIIWMDGTEDWHTGIFYGENSHDNKFWHSGAQQRLASVNRISGIEPCGTASQLFVIKAYHPDRVPKIAQLAIKTVPKDSSVVGNPNYSLLGTKFCVFDSLENAQAAAQNYGNKTIWGKSIGTIALDGNGFGVLRKGEVPSYSELVQTGSKHEYFKRGAQALEFNKKYYAVQLGAGKNFVNDKTVYPLNDARDSSSSFWADYNLIRTSAGMRFYVANTFNPYYTEAFRVQVASENSSVTDGNSDYSLLGARFAIFSDIEAATAAASAPVGSAERSGSNEKCLAQLLTNEAGIGWLRTGEVPDDASFKDENVRDEYFARHIKPLLIDTYYAVQLSAGANYEPSNSVYTFITTNSSLTVDGFDNIVYRATKDDVPIVYNKPVTDLEPTTVPPTSEPETTVPPTSEPETTVPPTSEPETTVPPTSEPETTVPPTSEPETTVPPTSEPETTVPPTSEPETTVPPATEPEKTYLCGDIDNNGYININDVTMLQRIIAEFRVEKPADYAENDALFLLVADTDGNGKITIKDATVIQRYLAEMSLDDDARIGITIPKSAAEPTQPANDGQEESTPVNEAWLHDEQ